MTREEGQLEMLDARERELREQIAAVTRRLAALQGLPTDRAQAVALAERLKIYVERDLPPLGAEAAQQELFVALHEALGMVGSTRTQPNSMRWSAQHATQPVEILEARLDNGAQSSSLRLRTSTGHLVRPLHQALGILLLLVAPMLAAGLLFAVAPPWLVMVGSMLGLGAGTAGYLAWVRRATRRALESLADALGQRLVARARLKVRVQEPELVRGASEADDPNEDEEGALTRARQRSSRGLS